MPFTTRVVTGLLAACLPLLSLADTGIGLTNRNGADKFLGILQDAVTSYAGSKSGVSVDVSDAKDDAAKQQAQVNAFVSKPVGAVIVMPVSSKTQAMTAAARKSGVPIVYINQRPAEPMGDGAVYVGSDESMAGRLQADMLAKKLGGKGNVVILKGPQDHDAAIGRTKAVKAVLAGHPGIKIVAEGFGNWKRSEGQRIVAELLKKGEAIDAIAANNDEMALGAVDALTAAGVPVGKVLVAGIDATPDALQSLKEGKLAATVLQNAKGQGRAALDLALKMAAKESVPKELMVPFELVTAENVARYAAR